ncbi:MAG: hypothetical protein AAGI46_10035 [Planctomycetota bacterium]
MAKAFYTQEEALEALATDDDGIKDLVESGRLTEYRDGNSLMYKGSQIEKLQGEGAGGLAPADSGGPIGLADSAGGISLDDSMGGSVAASISDDSGIGDANASMGESGIDLADTGLPAESTAGESRVPGSSGAPLVSDDTGEFSLSDTAMSSDMGGTAAGASQSGITIFEDDDVDPSAQTDMGGTGDQIALEGIGSGSGLLDLTQEADDTSFGAETFDEIMPESSVAGGTAVGASAIDTGAAPAGTRPAGVAYEVNDPQAPIFGGLAGGAAAVVLVGIVALALSAVNGDPGFLSFLFTETGEVAVGATGGLLVGLPIVGLIIGLVGGKMANNA